MKVKIINKSSNPCPTYATPLSAGMDVRANIEEPITLAPLQRVLVPTGLYIALPEGYECQARPRSGLAVKHGITVLNSPGTVVAKHEHVEWEEVEVLDETERGEGGFGSTGVQ